MTDVKFSKNVAIAPQGNFCKREKERNWKKEVKIDGEKREGKTLNHFLSATRKGEETSSPQPQSHSWDQCNILHKVHRGGGVLSCTESTPVLQGSHHSVHYCVRLREEKKKRREQRRRRKPVSLCWKDSAGKWSCDYLSLPAQLESPPPSDLKQHLPHSVPSSPNTGVTFECSTQTGKQRHPGYSWWWELTSEVPWILMWRIVCFIEEQREARWLPFRIC